MASLGSRAAVDGNLSCPIDNKRNIVAIKPVKSLKEGDW
jgi:hypothetical protein